MKLTNIFRLPRHKTFNYIPRYYDAKKEQEEKRKKELLELVEIEKQKMAIENNQQNNQKNTLEDYESDYQRTISSAFNRKQKEKIAINTNQLLIIGVLVGGCVLFWNFGTQGILFAIAGIVWVVFRMRMKK